MVYISNYFNYNNSSLWSIHENTGKKFGSKSTAINKIGRINVYEFKDNMTKQDSLDLFYKKIDCPYNENIVFFVDDLIYANWEHPCRYIFVNAITGESTIINETIHPRNFNKSSMDFISKANRPNTGRNLQTNQNAIERNESLNDHLYAVLINGKDEYRYWNDTSAMYCALKSYGFREENIIVHYRNGSSVYGGNLDNIGSINDFDYPAYKSSIITTFKNLSGELDNITEIPMLDHNDQLFIFVNDHGGYTGEQSYIVLDDEPMFPNEFASNIKDINCAQMMIVMEQCNSGGFAEPIIQTINPACKKRMIHTACQETEFSWYEVWETATDDTAGYLDYNSYNEFTYYWTSAIRGYFPGDRAWNLGYEVGTGAGVMWHDEINPDLNNDGFITMSEAFYYADYQDTYSPKIIDENGDSLGIYHIHPYVLNIMETDYHGEQPENPISMGTDGFLEDLLTMNGFTGLIKNNQIISGNFLLANSGLVVDDNVTLIISEDSKFTLADSSKITTKENSTLIIDNDVTFWGESLTRTENHELIAGNSLNVRGNLVLGSNAKFTSLEGKFWDGLNLYSTQDICINNVTFERCYISNYSDSIQITNSAFNMSNIKNYDNHLYVSNCDIDGFINSLNTTRNAVNIDIINTNISGEGDGIKLTGNSIFNIESCSITNNLDCGIDLHECSYNNSKIYNCEITNNTSNGVQIYSSSSDIESCLISNNNRGIFAARNSNVNLLKDPTSGSWNYDSVITGNILEEILFLDDCTMTIARNRNKIMDDDNNYLVSCPNSSFTRDFRTNFWGYYSNDYPSLPPANRFNPSNIWDNNPNDIGYKLLPLWNPGSPRAGSLSNARIKYEEGVDAKNEGNTLLAETSFKEVITSYPQSQYILSSARQLLQVEDNMYELQNYYLNEPNLNNNSNIDVISDYLANYCHLKLEDYNSAAQYYNEIISNSPSINDSIMASIDYAYMVLMNTNNRSNTQSLDHDKAYSEFSKHKTDLLTELNPVNSEYFSEEETGFDNNEIISNPTIQGNYPNPFNPKTTIKLSIPEETFVTLSVFNLKGQKIKELHSGILAKGFHSITWNGKSEQNNIAPSGLYLLKLDVEGYKSQSKKCILLK